MKKLVLFSLIVCGVTSYANYKPNKVVKQIAKYSVQVLQLKIDKPIIKKVKLHWNKRERVEL